MTQERPRELRIEEQESIAYLFNDLKNAKGIINIPEYFFIQPTIEEEKYAREDYECLWERLADEKQVEIPESISTFVGKVRFIQEELHFRDNCTRYGSPDYMETGQIFLENGALIEERKEAHGKLMSLSPKEIEELRAKALVSFPNEPYPYPFNRLIQSLFDTPQGRSSLLMNPSPRP